MWTDKPSTETVIIDLDLLKRAIEKLKGVKNGLPREEWRKVEHSLDIVEVMFYSKNNYYEVLKEGPLNNAKKFIYSIVEEKDIIDCEGPLF